MSRKNKISRSTENKWISRGINFYDLYVFFVNKFAGLVASQATTNLVSPIPASKIAKKEYMYAIAYSQKYIPTLLFLQFCRLGSFCINKGVYKVFIFQL